MNFNLTRIRPRGFLHSSAFTEVMDSVAWSLAELGHSANITENWIDANDRNIIFGAELLAPNQPQMFPAGTILYNLEQPSHPNMPKVRSIAQTCGLTVWDYSSRNLKDWQALGVNAKHVPIGYTPNLTRIPKAAVQDIDILFLGWMTPRRKAVLDELQAAGLKVVASDKCYGGGRDSLISRAKVCLNIHHDGRNLFEIVRVSYWLANSKCVVTEFSDDDADYEDLPLCRSYEREFVKRCLECIEDDMPTYGVEEFKRRDFAASVSAALNETTLDGPAAKVAARFAKGSPDIGHYLPWLRDHAKGTILEIGVRDGASTSAFLRGVEEHGGTVLSVDIQDCSGLFPGHPQWKFLRSDSQNPKLHVPNGLDIVFLDGDHTRSGFRADLERFFPLLKPGGAMICHDISPERGQTLEDCPGSDYPSIAIHQEYFQFCHLHHLRHEEIPGKYGLGVMYKPEAPVVDSDESWQASEALLSKE